MNLKEIGLEEISQDEMQFINGGGEGSFWYDLAYGIGYTIRAGKDIAASLRNNPSHGNAAVYK